MQTTRTAIVTGAASGLGREIAEGLTGFRVVVADHDEAAARECAARIPGSRAVTADVRDPADLHRIVAAAEELGGPHVLVNNAGGWSPGDQYPQAPVADWTATIALNLTAPMLLGQLVLEPMRRLGGGAIVNIASSAATAAGAYGSPEYAATKAALIRLTTSLTGLADSHRVRVMCVVPGWIGLPRAHEQMRRLPAAERVPLIPPAEVVAAVTGLIADGTAGQVVRL